MGMNGRKKDELSNAAAVLPSPLSYCLLLHSVQFLALSPSSSCGLCCLHQPSHPLCITLLCEELTNTPRAEFLFLRFHCWWLSPVKMTIFLITILLLHPECRWLLKMILFFLIFNSSFSGQMETELPFICLFQASCVPVWSHTAFIWLLLVGGETHTDKRGNKG